MKQGKKIKRYYILEDRVKVKGKYVTKNIRYLGTAKKILMDLEELDKLRKEAGNIIHGILERTQRGKDVKMKGFKSYKADYAKYRAKHGRDRRVNLTYSGRMLGAINSKHIPLGLRFYFASKSETDKAKWNQKTRKFFGADKAQIKYLKKQLSKL